MNYYNKAREEYERAMETVYDNLDSAKGYLETLSDEIEDLELDDVKYEKLDRLLSRAIGQLDMI